MIIYFVILLILLAILFRKKSLTTIPNKYYKCQHCALNKCQVPTLNGEQCYLSQYYKCPPYDGSYVQCTNNYASLDDICPCENRTFELCPYPYKISSKCYQTKFKKCGNPPKNIKCNPKHNLRVNMWHSDVYNNVHNNRIAYY